MGYRSVRWQLAGGHGGGALPGKKNQIFPLGVGRNQNRAKKRVNIGFTSVKSAET